MELNTIYQGNALEVQRTFPAKYIDMCMTSPPYWGLRDYRLHNTIWDGDENCDHDFYMTEKIIDSHKNKDFNERWGHSSGEKKQEQSQKIQLRDGFCQKCGAWKGQLGLEPTPELYIKHLCDIFDETWRVLKDTGSLWVNISDSYCSQGGPQVVNTINANRVGASDTQNAGKSRKVISGYKPKSLIGIPERFILEMMDRGWTRRNTIIWHKPNCMPTSAKDRFTVDFEYVYFFTKKKKYYFETQREPHTSTRWGGTNDSACKQGEYAMATKDGIRSHEKDYHPEGRNKRCVWRITTKPFKGAHFAVFPEELVETPIKAGCPRYVCKKCGKPREKIYKSDNPSKECFDEDGLVESNKIQNTSNPQSSKSLHRNDGGVYSTAKFMGYKECECNAGFKPGIVLDPFFGSGTLGIVATRLGRDYVGIELNPSFIEIAKGRLKEVQQELDVV